MTCKRNGLETGERQRTETCARRCTSRERLRGSHSVTGSARSGKRAEHAHAVVASQSRRGDRGSRSHSVSLIRFERVARERARRRVASRVAYSKFRCFTTVCVLRSACKSERQGCRESVPRKAPESRRVFFRFVFRALRPFARCLNTSEIDRK